MTTTTIYITALFFGAAIGIIYMLAKRKEKEVFPKVLNALKVEPFNEEEYASNRIRVEGTNIYINNAESLRYRDIEIKPVLKLETALPEVTIYEDSNPIRTFTIEPKGDTDLEGYYFHSSIRVNANSSVQIDGYLSKDPQQYGDNAEGIRFQPFFLSDRRSLTRSLREKECSSAGCIMKGLSLRMTLGLSAFVTNAIGVLVCRFTMPAFRKYSIFIPHTQRKPYWFLIAVCWERSQYSSRQISICRS